MNIKEIWEKYQESDKHDPILDGALSTFRELTGMSIEDTIETIDSIASGDISKLANYKPRVELFKKQAIDISSTLASFLDNNDIDGAAKFMSKIMVSGSGKNKTDLVSAFHSFTTDKHVSAQDKQKLADSMKNLKVWNSFQQLYQNNIHHILSGNKTIGKAWIKDPGTFFHAIQEFGQARHQGAPGYAKFHLLMKVVKIIITRFSMIAAIIGIGSLAYYGYKKVKNMVDSFTNKAATTPSTKKKLNEDTSESPSNNKIKTEDTASEEGRQLLDAIDKKTKSGGI